jgi:hypothetical protein
LILPEVDSERVDDEWADVKAGLVEINVESVQSDGKIDQILFLLVRVNITEPRGDDHLPAWGTVLGEFVVRMRMSILRVQLSRSPDPDW